MAVHSNSKVKKKLFYVHTTLIILLISFLFFIFSLPFLSSLFIRLSHFLALFFSQNSLLLLKIFTQILFFFFSNFLSFFSIFSMLCEGLFFCCVGVVGHWRRSHAVGMVSHQFQVMLWVWICAVVFVGLAVGFVWWVIDVVVMPWVWWVIGFGSCRGLVVS